jgi:chromosome partitioning protein
LPAILFAGDEGADMQTITLGSIKGGSGKSTLSIIMVNALSRAGYRCLAIDTDMSNHSLSFYFNGGIPYETIYEKNIFKVFTGSPIMNNVLPINERLDLLHADVRMSALRSIGNFKLLKKALCGLEYDYIIIDTAPTFDNVIINVLTASDILVVPVQQDVFNYQSLKYLFQELGELDLPELDTQVVLNQFEKPRTDNKEAYSNQLLNLFAQDAVLAPFINPARVPKSAILKKYINGQDYHLNTRSETRKLYGELVALIRSLTGVAIEGDI